MKIRPIVYVKFAFAAFSLYVLLRFVPLADIARVFGDASAVWFVVGVLLQFLLRASATLRMQVIAANQGMALTLVQLYRILLTTQFYSLFLPTPLAAGGVSWVKYMQHGAGKSAAAAAVVVNRAIGLCTMLTLGICAWAIDRLDGQPVVVAVVVILAAIAIGFVTLWPPQTAPRVRSFENAPGWLQRLSQPLHRLLLLRRLSRSDKLIVAASTIVQELLGAAAFVSFAIAVGADVSLLSAIWIGAAVSTVLLLPITVAGLGVREMSLVGFGAIIGIPAPTAMAWSFTILAGTVVVAAVGGLTEAHAAARRVENLFKSRPGDAGRRLDR